MCWGWCMETPESYLSPQTVVSPTQWFVPEGLHRNYVCSLQCHTHTPLHLHDFGLWKHPSSISNECCVFPVCRLRGLWQWHKYFIVINSWLTGGRVWGCGHRSKRGSINGKHIKYRFLTLMNAWFSSGHHLKIPAGLSVRSMEQFFDGAQELADYFISARSKPDPNQRGHPNWENSSPSLNSQ